MEFSSCDDRVESEHTGVCFVEISKIPEMYDSFLCWGIIIWQSLPDIVSFLD